MPSMNMAVRIDCKGFPPAAESRIARSTKYAASVVASRPTTKFVTKLPTSDWKVASHEVLIPPPGSGTPTPNELNQPSNGCRVRNTIAQNIHFVKLPPMTKLIPPPSRRRLMPANTRLRQAADGASSNKTFTMSFKSWGVATVLNLHSKNGSGHGKCGRQLNLADFELPALFTSGILTCLLLSNTSCSVRDPVLDQSSHPGDREQCSGR